MIIEIARGHIRIQMNGRTVTVGGEMLVPSPGLADFLIYQSSIARWDPPYNNEIISDPERIIITLAIRDELGALGRVVEVLP
jgi:hypothetical protein